MSDVPYHTVIKEIPIDERPRERLAQYGESALSTAELIAIIIRTGSRNQNAVGLAQRLLSQFEGLAGLHRASVIELCGVLGVGEAKAVQIKAAIELGRRVLTAAVDARAQILNPSDAAHPLMAALGYLQQEQLHVLLLDSKHYVMRRVLVYSGNVNTSMIRVSEVFREAIRDNAAAMIVAHNHPSGDPTPSREDVEVTRAIVKAGGLLDIAVLDHLVIGRRDYVSLRERKLGFA